MSDKILVIAEKPSVAADFTKVLPDKFKKEKNYYEGENYIISYAVGHLLTIAEPNEIDPKFKGWSLKNLPIIPESFPLKPIEKSKTQLNVLAKLIRKKEVTQIINACDAGREGELIFRYIMDYVQLKRKVNKPLKRLWLQSMTAGAIKKAFEDLKADEELLSLADAAKSRSEADWLIGINGSRGLTAYNSKMGGFFLTPCGRVQTPTLSMIVEREKLRENFKSEIYYNLMADFSCDKDEYQGKWFDPGFSKDPKNSHKTADRIWDFNKASEIEKKCKGKEAKVTESSKPSSQRSPLLYDLTSLQREANSRFGYSAKMTLGIAQSLYEKYKLLTYPRTSSRHLPEDYIPSVKSVLETLKAGDYSIFASEALNKNYVKADKRIFDNKKISDHFAIIPTTTKAPKKLPDRESKIYEMVVQRFLAVFFPPAKFLNTLRISMVEGESFKTEGKVLVEAGWKAIYKQSEQEKTLSPLKKDKRVLADKIEILEDETKPPARFSESTLLSAMESAGKLVEDEELRDALKERGLGTPATRAAIIEKLVYDRYVVREDKALVPTSKAFDLLDLISVMKIDNLKSPKLTGDWEYKLGQIERGKMTRDEFMSEIKNATKQIIESVKGFEEDSTKKEAPFSPLEGMKFYETISRYKSEDESYMIRKILGGRRMSPEEIKELLIKRKLGPMEGFRSKKGKPFTASIILNENNKVQFVFSNAEADEDIDLNNAKVIGKSPVDDSDVYMTETAYISQSAIDKKNTGLRINRVILGKEISEENIKLMLSGEKSNLIEGFRSTKKNRLFDAFLHLTKTGRVRFSFPPPKKGGRKKAVSKETKEKEA